MTEQKYANMEEAIKAMPQSYESGRSAGEILQWWHSSRLLMEKFDPDTFEVMESMTKFILEAQVMNEKLMARLSCHDTEKDELLRLGINAKYSTVRQTLQEKLKEDGDNSGQ